MKPSDQHQDSFPVQKNSVLSGHSKIKTKVLKTNGSLMKVESIAECSPWSILQYFWPSLSVNRFCEPMFCVLLSCLLKAGFLVQHGFIEGFGGAGGLVMLYANSKSKWQHVHSHRLISAFAIHFLEGILTAFATWHFSIFWSVCVGEPASLSLA